MNSTIRQLEVFIEIYHSGNLTRAAERLGLSQSAVSLQLQQLEKLYGLRLFDRTTRALHPTPAAKQAIASAEKILSASLALTQEMQNQNRLSTGRLVFLASAAFASTFLPSILSLFNRSYPGISVSFYDLPGHLLVEKLLAGDAEFALGAIDGCIPDATLEPILKGRLSAIGLSKGSLADRKSISWEELTSQPTISIRRETALRLRIDGELTQAGRRFVPRYETSIFQTALAMSSAGLGIAVLPDYTLWRQQFPMLVARPLVRPSIIRPVNIIRKTGHSLSPAAIKFLGIVRTEFSKLRQSA